MGLLRIFDNFDGKGFVAHEKSKDPYQPPPFFSGENPPVQFMGLQLNSSGTAGKAPWTDVSPASYSLKLGLFRVTAGTQLAFQDVWNDDAMLFVKTGTLVYDSAAVDAALAIETSGVNCILEAEVTLTGLGAYKQQIPITLRKGYITPANPSIPAGEVTATQAWVLQACVPRDGTNLDKNPLQETYGLTIPSKLPFRRWVDDNFVEHRDPA